MNKLAKYTYFVPQKITYRSFGIIPHRALMKQGFEVDGKRVDVEMAFKDPKYPFRVAIVCAMWLTGFDVESLSTL